MINFKSGLTGKCILVGAQILVFHLSLVISQINCKTQLSVIYDYHGIFIIKVNKSIFIPIRNF